VLAVAAIIAATSLLTTRRLGEALPDASVWIAVMATPERLTIEATAAASGGALPSRLGHAQ